MSKNFNTDIFWPTFLFSGSLVLVLLLAIIIFVYVHPKPPVFWKRSDYVYFGFSIIGAILGLTDLTIKEWQKEVHDNQIRRSTVIMRLISGTGSVLQSCEKITDVEKLREQYSREMKQGILRDLNRPTGFYDMILSDSIKNLYFYSKEECSLTQKIVAPAIGSLQPRAFKAESILDIYTVSMCELIVNKAECDELLFKDNIPASSDLMKIKLSDFQGGGNAHLTSPSSVYSTLVYSPLKEIAVYNEQEHILSDKIKDFAWMHKIRSFWPILFGIGLAVRLAKIHAEVKDEIFKAKSLNKNAS
jgi:hypothetical protein